jgi:DMSO/TMAO reductase YedYZ molybdopterin-dependent catalytic subunit
VTDDARELSRRTRRSFMTGAIAAVAGFAGYEWIRTRRPEAGTPWPLRESLNLNEQIARGYFQPVRLAPQFSVTQAGMPKINGDIGLESEPDEANWRLHVEGLQTDDGTASLTMTDIHALPRVSFVTELQCIEGWTTKVSWTGARFSDFAARYRPGPASYVGMTTPDGGYYVGLDLASAMHPQTLLCYEMDGRPLEPDHGAPLRLVIPVKYGIKNLKRIGRIRFTTDRPPDYWAERGYDYYAGF